MHPVLKILHDRMLGKASSAVLAIIGCGGGQRWVIAGGVTTYLRVMGIHADIIGGASGGALAMMFYADGGCTGRAMVLRCLTNKGFARDNGTKFISRRRLLKGQPPMDLNGLFDDAFRLRYPLNLDALVGSERPIFVSATARDGESLIHRLDGSSTAFVRRAIHDTARIPLLAHDPTDPDVLWDGSLSNDAPIDEAFRLGATQVLVINPRGGNYQPGKRGLLDKLYMEPKLRKVAPDLLQLWMQRHANFAATMAKYADDPRVYHLQLPTVAVQTQTTDEALLAAGVKAGWDYMASLLQPAQPPDYPAAWQPVLREHGLLA